MEHFDGVPVWHASYALQPTRPVDQWTPAQWVHGVMALHEALDGVGEAPPVALEADGRAMHVRRHLTRRERRGVLVRDVRRDQGEVARRIDLVAGVTGIPAATLRRLEGL